MKDSDSQCCSSSYGFLGGGVLKYVWVQVEASGVERDGGSVV